MNMIIVEGLAMLAIGLAAIGVMGTVVVLGMRETAKELTPTSWRPLGEWNETDMCRPRTFQSIEEFVDWVEGYALISRGRGEVRVVPIDSENFWNGTHRNYEEQWDTHVVTFLGVRIGYVSRAIPTLMD